MTQIQKLGFWICAVLLILIWSSVIAWARLIGQYNFVWCYDLNCVIAWARLIGQYNFVWCYDLNCIIAWASLIGYSFDWPITVRCYPPSHAVPIPNRFLYSATVFSWILIVRPRDCTSSSIIKYNFASNQCTVLECMAQCKNGMVWCLLFSM